VIAISLQSGSTGNCTYVEQDGVSLLFDAGISGLQTQRRLAAFGRDVRLAAGVILSHDHADHVRCAGILQRKFHLPIHVTPATLAAARSYRDLGELRDVRHFQAGQALAFGALTVQTIPTPHDGVDGVAFVVSGGRRRLGILTDLGHVFDGLPDLLATLDAVFLESNYDADMLRDGPYPEFLKRRIVGPRGHISNVESAELLHRAGRKLKWACLSHLSEINNAPHVAVATHREIHGGSIPLYVASRYDAVGLFEV